MANYFSDKTAIHQLEFDRTATSGVTGTGYHRWYEVVNDGFNALNISTYHKAGNHESGQHTKESVSGATMQLVFNTSAQTADELQDLIDAGADGTEIHNLVEESSYGAVTYSLPIIHLENKGVSVKVYVRFSDNISLLTYESLGTAGDAAFETNLT